MQIIRKQVYFIALRNQMIIRTISGSENLDTVNKSKLKSWKEIPGPLSLPIVGQMLHFLPGGALSNIETMQSVLCTKYGPIVRLEGKFEAPTLIFLLDAESSAQILRSENWLPFRPGFASLEHHRKMMNENDLEKFTGLLTDQGETWKKFRSTVNPIMLHTKTIKLYSKILNEVSEDMVERLKKKRNDKNEIEGDFDTEMNLWALESIGVVALGGRISCLDTNLPEDSPARKLIDNVRDIFTLSSKLDFRPSAWRYIATPTYKKAMHAYGEQMRLGKYFINKAIEQYKKRKTVNEDEKSVLEKLLEINEKVAVIMASDMLLAGVDTTANIMIAMLYQLAKNPEKQEKLRREVMTEGDSKPYLKACIKETMRIMPVVAGNLRLTTREYSILGYLIPKNMLVTFGHQYLSVSDEQFPRAKEFIPERWLVDKSDPLNYGNAHPFAFSPFGFGTRSCIGRRIAELELETFLSKMVQAFSIEWHGPPPKTHLAAINYLVGPFHFVFKDV